MKEVEFHFNAPDKLAYACRLLRKARASGARMVVLGDAAFLAQLDAALWTFSAAEFLPHCRLTAPAATLSASPIWLAEGIPAEADHGLLINMGREVPEGFERFGRFIEVVSQAEDDAQAARQRWKHYKGLGLGLVRHDLAAASA